MTAPSMGEAGNVERLASEPTAQPGGHRRALVIGARTALLMLLIAAVALVGLGFAALAVADPPEVTGWLRSVFGTVFGVMAVSMAMVLGLPAAIGVWAMSGATAPDAVPALSGRVQRTLSVIAVATVALTALVVLTLGDRLTLLDLALVGLVALPMLGLAGAASYSPHRGRARLSAAAVTVSAVGVTWIVLHAYGSLSP